MLHTIHYRLQIPDDDSTPIENIITTLDEHFKAQTNEALRRREVFSCRQMIGERVNEFYVRVKTRAEAVEVCTRSHAGCESTELKQVILMGVSDQELVQKLTDVIPTHSLDQVVQYSGSQTHNQRYHFSFNCCSWCFLIHEGEESEPA